MSLTNCEINLMVTWSSNCVITNSTGAEIFATPGTKCYVPVVALPAQDNAKFLMQLKSGIRRTINWNK